jgi:hypothetical protein
MVAMKKVQNGEFEITYAVNPPVTNEKLNPLFASAWEKHTFWDFLPVLKYRLAYVCAYYVEHMVGFVNLAWDGGQPAFILDTTVHRVFNTTASVNGSLKRRRNSREKNRRMDSRRFRTASRNVLFRQMRLPQHQSRGFEN